MIWLREGNNIVGYAPILKKEYNDDEIKQMSKFSYYEGWSELSRFVMRIQGIEYEEDEGFVFDKNDIIKPIDVDCGFAFECFWSEVENEECMNTYIKQIYDVFENLRLYRMEQHSIKNMREVAKASKENMRFYISNRTISSMYNDIERVVNEAEHITINLNKILSLFSKYKYPLPRIFDIPSDEVIVYLNTKRKIEKKLMCF